MTDAGCRGTVLKKVDAYFEITARGSTYAQEVRGGVATFLTMSYILLVNPQILTQWLAVDDEYPELAPVKDEVAKSIATSTALVCGLGCLAVGLASKMPFSVGPGMGLNTFAAALYVRAQTHADMAESEAAWAMVSTATFLSGALLAFMSAVGAVSPIITNLPDTLKTGIMVGIGAFQAFVGFRAMAVMAPTGDDNIIALGPPPDFTWEARGGVTSGYAQMLFLAALLLTTALFERGVKGSILLGILFCTGSNYTLGTLDFAGFFEGGNVAEYLPQVVAILLITIFDCGGVQYGVAKLLDLPARRRRVDTAAYNEQVFSPTNEADPAGKPGSPPRRFDEADTSRCAEFDRLEKQQARLEELEADGLAGVAPLKAQVAEKLAELGGKALPPPPPPPVATLGLNEGELLPKRTAQVTFIIVGLMNMVAGVLGASPCIVFLECAAGVQEGAATGFASLVTGALFLLTTFLAPIFQSVPLAASAGPLIFIGCLMMSHVGEIRWNELPHALPAFVTILLMPFTSSIPPGIVAGLVVYYALKHILALYDAVACWWRSRRGTADPDAAGPPPPCEPTGEGQDAELPQTKPAAA